MGDFVSGLLTMGHAVAAVFFLKFWARTRDWLFVAFAIAFALFGLEQALLTLVDVPREERSWLYLLRLLGFLLIIAAIVRKNREGDAPGPRSEGR